jgi:hypothetical protein
VGTADRPPSIAPRAAAASRDVLMPATSPEKGTRKNFRRLAVCFTFCEMKSTSTIRRFDVGDYGPCNHRNRVDNPETSEAACASRIFC